jgi:hypothetical protein
MLGDDGLRDDRLLKTFDRVWPELEQSLSTIRSDATLKPVAVVPAREVSDMFEEILRLLRALAQPAQLASDTLGVTLAGANVPELPRSSLLTQLRIKHALGQITTGKAHLAEALISLFFGAMRPEAYSEETLQGLREMRLLDHNNELTDLAGPVVEKLRIRLDP